MNRKQEKQLIMAVDDNEQLLYLIKEFLEIYNYQVEIFPDFLSALDFYKENHTMVTALLLDMQLENKYAYLVTIPAFLAISQKVSIIAMSGAVNLKDIPEDVRTKITPLKRGPCTEYRIKYFLRKPYELKQLLNILATIEKAHEVYISKLQI